MLLGIGMKKKVENNILTPAQLPQEEAEEEDPGEPLSPRQQQQEQELSSPESTPRQMRSLVRIYETCNLAILETGSFEEASKHEVWVKAMEEEIKMIEKNNTWELVDHPCNTPISRASRRKHFPKTRTNLSRL